MSDITLSAGVRTNLQSLQNIKTLLTTSQNRLATGKKVNSALDNPTNFFVAQSLSDRATGLNTLLDGINNGISTVQTASKGLDSVYKALQSAQGIIDKTKSDVATISNQARGTAVVNNAVTQTSLGFANNDTLTFTDSVTGAATTINLGTIGTHNVQDLLDTINTQGNGVYTAALNNGNIVINSNAKNAFNITSNNAAALTATLGTTTASTTSGSYDQTKLDSYAKQFNEILTSIDQFAADSSFNGVNLLRSGNDLKVNYNSDGTSSTTLKSQDITYTDLGLTTIPTGGTATLSDFTTKVTAITNALSTVRLTQGDYATKLSTMQNRQDFSTSVANTLKTGSDNLTLADQNEEAANVLALQTRQSLSQSALSLAVQADQSVLQLLK
ncbi:flagellar protein [Terrarubrum flagellatum]|uniref:flagellin N-terminal helical domain-containing protein n=1 Tax=Terrirubrum flagellatum TaxID=2895980 RepID=UPI003145415D